MHYENRQAPEGVNVTPHNPFLYFLKLLFLAFVIIGLVLLAVNIFASHAARSIPFEYEQHVTELVDYDFGGPVESVEMQRYLEELAEKISANMPIPDDMDIVVHYNPENVFNAFATLGGNVVFYRELLSRMPHENALAMVVAHELAHVLHRDPIAGIGGGLASVLALGQLMSGSGYKTASRVLGMSGALGSLKFSRDMESAADRAALAAMVKTYGHVAGADELFKVFHAERERHADDSESLAESWAGSFASTHPQDLDRIDAIAEQAKANDWPIEGELTRLPALFYSWMAGSQIQE